MDPVLTGQLLAAGSNVLGKAMQTAPAGPSSVYDTSAYKSVFDSSGWNVNFGSGSVSSQATKTAEADPIWPKAGLTGTSTNWQTMALIGLGVVAVWAITRRR